VGLDAGMGRHFGGEFPPPDSGLSTEEAIDQMVELNITWVVIHQGSNLNREQQQLATSNVNPAVMPIPSIYSSRWKQKRPKIGRFGLTLTVDGLLMLCLLVAYINYPLRSDLMGTPSLQTFVDACHAKGIFVKLYFTTR
jgi:hypothetical protein